MASVLPVPADTEVHEDDPIIVGELLEVVSPRPNPPYVLYPHPNNL